MRQKHIGVFFRYIFPVIVAHLQNADAEFHKVV